MLRHRLTDEQWTLITDLFPPPKRMGRPRRDPREIVDGILWILNTGSPWRDLPAELPPKSTIWRYFDRWNDDGTLQAVLDRLQHHVKIDAELWCVDGTVVRAAKCAAGGGKRGIRMNRATTRSAAAAAV